MSDPRGLQEVGTKSEDVVEEKEVAKRYCCASSRRKSMEQRTISVWKSGILRSTKVVAFQQKGIKGHVATDGSLLGMAGKWVAWEMAIVQSRVL